jgi:hypothetical protein
VNRTHEVEGSNPFASTRLLLRSFQTFFRGGASRASLNVPERPGRLHSDDAHAGLQDVQCRGRRGLGQDSDPEFHGVMPDDTHRRRTAQALCEELPAMGVAKDVVLVTETRVPEYGDEP